MTRLISCFQIQPYLGKLNKFKYIQAISKLRMSSHKLAIESGRWDRPNRIPVDERKCAECEVLEDEYRFVIECKLFNDLRAKYLPRYFWIRPKGGITPEEDHEDLTTSWKIEGRSENVVKMKPVQVYKIILRPYHVLTTFTSRSCQVLTTSIRFPMSSYHALTTLTPFIVRSYYVLNTTKQTALRAYHAFSTF